MHEFFHGWVGSPGFMPHGMGYRWHPHAMAQRRLRALIAAAYSAIPVSLYDQVHERRAQIPSRDTADVRRIHPALRHDAPHGDLDGLASALPRHLTKPVDPNAVTELVAAAVTSERMGG